MMTRATVCPHCGHKSVMNQFGQTASIDYPTHGRFDEAAFRCSGCSRLVIGTSTEAQSDPQSHKHIITTVDGRPIADGVDLEWLPKVIETRHFPDVPPYIGEGASEAFLCMSAGAYRSAIIMSRAVFEAAAKDRGAPEKKRLDKKIEWLLEEGHLSKKVTSAATELRFIGNTMAHGDRLESDGPLEYVTREEVEDTLRIMSTLLDDLYTEIAPNTARQKRITGASVPSEEADADT